jgi:hypothetical protein
MSDYQKVHIKSLGRPKLLKLMKGGAVRVSRPESAMEAMEMFILPQHTKSIMGKFGKGQAHTLKLSADEIQRNSMQGGSFYSMGKKALKFAAPVLKHAARAGITMGSAALAAAQPELIPFIPMGAAALGTMSDNAFESLGNMDTSDAVDEGAYSPEDYGGEYGNMARNYATDYIQKHPSYQRGLSEVSKYEPVLQKSQAPAYMKYADENPYSSMGNAGMRELAQYGNLGANIHETANHAKAAVHRQSVPHRGSSQQLRQIHAGRQRGRGLYAGGGLYAGSMRGQGVEKSTVRIGGNLISAFGGMHPAVLSQPTSVNFASRNFMSPAMAAMVH